MTAIIDTSSLLAIVRYYLSIKGGEELLRFLEQKFMSRELVLLTSIHREAARTQQGIALEKMPFLNEKSRRVDDSKLMPPAPKKFSNLLENNFCIPLMRKRLSQDEFEQQKAAYMKTGDARMVLYALNNPELDPVIITEETAQSNDGKLFKKLPLICGYLDIKSMTIAQWLSANGMALKWALQ